MREKYFDPEVHDTDILVVDERIVHDLKHAVSRSEEGQQDFPIISLLEDLDSDNVYLDHSALDSLYDASYDNASMVDVEGLARIEEFLAENTTNLDMEEWSDQLGEQGDELYKHVVNYQDAVLLTYDGDFSEFDMALTPEEYLESNRAIETLNEVL